MHNKLLSVGIIATLWSVSIARAIAQQYFLEETIQSNSTGTVLSSEIADVSSLAEEDSDSLMAQLAVDERRSSPGHGDGDGDGDGEGDGDGDGDGEGEGEWERDVVGWIIRRDVG